MYRIRADIFESGGGECPVVRHEFYGSTIDRAQGIFESHMRTDEFLRDCVNRGRWKDVECGLHISLYRRVKGRWERYGGEPRKNPTRRGRRRR